MKANRLTSFLLAVFSFSFGLYSCRAVQPAWTLPIKLGDPKSKVYAVLGSPSYTPPAADIEWFQNSGLAIVYDPTGHVSSIVFHGESNQSFVTFRQPIIYGLKITDPLDKLIQVLGEPASAERDPVDLYLEQQWLELGQRREVQSNRRVYKWRKPPYFIEVMIHTKDFSQGNKLFKAGTIIHFKVSKAIGGE